MGLLEIVIGYTRVRRLNFSKNQVNVDWAHFKFAQGHVSAPHNDDLRYTVWLLQVFFEGLVKRAAVIKAIKSCEHEIQVRIMVINT